MKHNSKVIQTIVIVGVFSLASCSTEPSRVDTRSATTEQGIEKQASSSDAEGIPTEVTEKAKEEIDEAVGGSTEENLGSAAEKEEHTDTPIEDFDSVVTAPDGSTALICEADHLPTGKNRPTFRRLSKSELISSIQNLGLLEVGATLKKSFPPEITNLGFDSMNENIKIGSGHVFSLWDAAFEGARTLAAQYLAGTNCAFEGDAPLSSCQISLLNIASQEIILKNFGPLKEFEIIKKNAKSNQELLELGISYLLQTPDYFYRTQYGDSNTEALTQRQIESAIVFYLTGGSPTAQDRDFSKTLDLRKSAERLKFANGLLARV